MPDSRRDLEDAATFAFRGGVLHGEDVPLPEVAARFATPVYVYSRRAFAVQFAALQRAFAALSPRICFSIKSCHNLHLLRLLREQGASFDAVSIGEIRRALEAGAAPADVVFAGVGKTHAELVEAVRLGVGCFNVESRPELEALAECARRAAAPVTAALRVNPDVDAATHPYTTTGTKENKFGVDFDEARDLFGRFRGHPALHLCGVHLHIGSPVNTVAPYEEAVSKALALIGELRATGSPIELFNLGGGWGTCYRDDDAPPLDRYAAALAPLLAGSGLRVHLEPGRSIAANAGLLLTRVVYVKQGKARRFVIVDAAMTDLIRPALYGAYHFLWPVDPGPAFMPLSRAEQQSLPGLEEVDVVGGVCESSDFLAKGRRLPPMRGGDLLGVFSAGAYGAVMSSQYNSRPRAPEVLIDGGEMRLIRRRETFDDLVQCEREA